MHDPFIPRVGGVLSADIAVPEHEREMRFYSRVLCTGEHPFWREDLMNNRGMPIIGLGARSTEYEDLPLQWMPHIQVVDVAEGVRQSLVLGGRELMHGKDNDGRSQWAVLLDPNGAAFGLIPVVPTEALPKAEGANTAEASDRLGCIYWLHLTVPNPAVTRDFYRQVVGWSVKDVEMKDDAEPYTDYSLLGQDGRPAAGVCHLRGVNIGLPPVWLIHLPVGDLAESLGRVQDEGGKVVKATKGADGEYIHAAVQDPVGVWLALVAG